MSKRGLIDLMDLLGFAERVEQAYSGYPHVDEEVALLAEQVKLLIAEHVELRRQMQSITESPQNTFVDREVLEG